MMNKRVKRKWVKALRSGEYKQGLGRLGHPDGTYCCLGVLVEEMTPGFCRRHLDGIEGEILSVDGMMGQIPDDLAIMWGLDMGAQNRLSKLNDQGSSFRRIATWIEKNL